MSLKRRRCKRRGIDQEDVWLLGRELTRGVKLGGRREVEIFEAEEEVLSGRRAVGKISVRRDRINYYAAASALHRSP